MPELRQAVVVSVLKELPSKAGWVAIQLDADSLIRRHNFRIGAVSIGASYDQPAVQAYHVIGHRAEALGDVAMDAMRCELAELGFLYSCQVRVVFGSSEQIENGVRA